jgi:hypothetical protein
MDTPMTRRDLNLLLPLLAGSNAIARDSPDEKKLPSAMFKFDELPVKAGGENRTRAVLNGATHQGFRGGTASDGAGCGDGAACAA